MRQPFLIWWYPRPDLNRHGRNGQRILSPSCLPIPPLGHPWIKKPRFSGVGAENGTRTRDPDLGKVMLYQLSYFRLFALSGCKYTITF